MSTQLFPRTEDSTILERLAGVPAGTAAASEAYGPMPADTGNYEADIDAFTAWREAMPEDVVTYRQFTDYGWGSVQAWRNIAAWGLDVACDETDDRTRVFLILFEQGVITGRKLNGVSIEELGGVYWA
jgi:hypothetical protein